MSNKIISCKFYALEVELTSPLCVSNGMTEYTDSDVIRNGNGELFIPGTSLAGAFRNYTEKKKNEESIFGYSDGDKGKMSSVYISDMYFDENTVKVSIRDRVQLSLEKQVNNKFDTEIIETGAKGIIYFHYVVRENSNDTPKVEEQVVNIINAIANGDIRIGSDKNRGFGRLKICAVYSKEFDKNLLDNMVDFKSNYKCLAVYDATKTYDAWSKSKEQDNVVNDSKYVKISVPLKLTGGISIRNYSVKPNEADFEHIKCNGKPIIPGSSWNGAIRSDCIRILKELELRMEKVENCIDAWFGCIKSSSTDINSAEVHQSMIVFGESVIDKGVEKTLTRNKINRFDGSTIDGALYTEKVQYGGETTLDIMIRKDEKIEYKALVGLILLVSSDLKKGYIAVGGQGAIGRGLFEENGEILIVDGEDSSIDYNKALYDFVNSERSVANAVG